MKKKLLLSLPITAAFFSFNTAHASQNSYEYNNWYVGGNIGITKNNTTTSNFLDNPDFCSFTGFIDCSADDSDTAFNIFGGYQINKHFSVELGYVDLGNTANLTAGAFGVTGKLKQETSAITVIAKGKHQLGDSKFSAFGKAGLARWKSKASFDVTPTGLANNRTKTETGIDPVVGVGLEYKVNKRVNLQAGWDRYLGVGDNNKGYDVGADKLRTIDTDVDVLYVGATFSF